MNNCAPKECATCGQPICPVCGKHSERRDSDYVCPMHGLLEVAA